MAKCTHKWAVSGRSGYDTIEFTCGKCNKKKERELSKKEVKICKKDEQILSENGQALNALLNEWYTIQKKFPKGKELITASYKWAIKNKLKWITVEDSHGCDGLVLLVPHENNELYLGTSLIFIPQCNNLQAERFRFFLPANGSLELLIKGLRKAYGLENKPRDKAYKPKWEFLPKTSPKGHVQRSAKG